MATNNPIDSLNPIQVALGGQGNATLTANGVLYGNGTGAVGSTAVGLTNQILYSNGAGNAPTFQGIHGNGLVLIATKTAASGTSITFTSGITATYNNYMFKINNYWSSGTTDNIVCQVSTNGGVSYINTGYTSGNTYSLITTTNNSNSSTYLYIQGTPAQSYNGTAYFFGVTSGTNPQFCGIGTSQLSNVTVENWIGSISTSSINAFKFYTLSGSTFANLRISMYGFNQ